MRNLVLSHLVIAAGCLAAPGSGCLLQLKQVGPVRVGMTIAQARQVLRGTTLKASEDADHMTILTVLRDGARVMDLYPDADEPRVERAQIIVIRVYDPACATAEGVHPGSPLGDVEKSLGKLVRIEHVEGESAEFAEFQRIPNWLGIQAGRGEAGVYAKGKRCTDHYAPSAKVQSLWVSGPTSSSRHFIDDSECNEPAR